MALVSRKAVTTVQAIVVVAIVVIASAAGAFYYLSLPKGPPGITEVVIGYTQSITGARAKEGSYYVKAYNMWRDDVNAKGGIAGVPVRLVGYDDKWDPTTVGSLYERLATVDKVDAFLGPTGTATGYVALTVAEKYHIPLAVFSTDPVMFSKGYKYVFSMAAMSDRSVDSLFEWGRKYATPPLKTFVLVYGTDGTGEAANSAIPRYQALGYDLLLSVQVPLNINDFSPVISKIKPLNPDIVATSLTILPANVLFMQQARELDLNPKIFYTAVGPGVQPDWSKTLGKTGEYTLGQSFWEPTLSDKYYPGTTAFSAAYGKKYSEEPNYYAAGGYAHAKLIEIAIRQYFNQYGKVKIDGEKLRNIIVNIDSSEDGLLFGPVKFNEQGFIPTRHCVIIQTQNSQKVPVIFPDGSPYTGNQIWSPVPPWNQRP